MMEWSQLLNDRRPGAVRKEVQAALRSPFEQDYDRVIFSNPFRSLQDKTQVFPLPEHDFVHNRLTHSLEVSSIGRSLGKKAGHHILQRHKRQLSPYSAHDIAFIVSTAALTHDIGNPPFGHAGEQAISDYFRFNDKAKNWQEEVGRKSWEDLTAFEGNAQGFRLLATGKYQGLRLTAASLASFTKYPCASWLAQRDPERKSQKKYGYFQSERTHFAEVAQLTGLKPLSDDADVWCRHPLAFLVEAADDMCYLLIDMEDAVRLRLITEKEATEFLAEIIGSRFDPQKLSRISSLNERIGLLRALALNVLVEAVTACFLDHETELLKGNFDRSLVDVIPQVEVLQEISALSVERIYRSVEPLEREAAGYEVLQGLLDIVISTGFQIRESGKASGQYRSIARLMPEEYRFDREMDLELMFRTAIDFVAGMSDKYALRFYRKIRGISF